MHLDSMNVVLRYACKVLTQKIMHYDSDEDGVLRTEIMWNVHEMKTVTKIEDPNLSIFLWHRFPHTPNLIEIKDPKCASIAMKHLSHVTDEILSKKLGKVTYL